MDEVTSTASLPWQMRSTLALALETLLAWTTTNRTTVSGYALAGGAARAPTDPTLEALRVLCRPGYLPAPQYTSLLVELKRLSAQLDRRLPSLIRWRCCSAVPVLMERLETLLAELDQRLATPATPLPPAARQRKQRQRRGLTPTEGVTGGDGPVCCNSSACCTPPPQAVESRVPEVIYRWLRHYSHLCSHAPEVVGALLGLLRQCPGATAVIPARARAGGTVSASTASPRSSPSTRLLESTTTAHTLLRLGRPASVGPWGVCSATLVRLSSVQQAQNPMRLWWRGASIWWRWC